MPDEISMVFFNAELYYFNEEIKSNSKVKVTFVEDLKGSATGLLRLQSTYNLVADDLTNGRIKHLNTSSKLTGEI